MLTLNQFLRAPVAGRLPAASSEITGTIPVSDLDLRVSRLGRGERLVTWSRVALAAFALTAVWVDPPADPARSALPAYAVLLAYLVYSVVLALVLSSVAAPLPRVGMFAHVVDIALAIAINALTGVGGPFFVLFIFVLVAAALRWQWQGIVATGTVVLAAYVLVALFGPESVGHVEFELDRFIIRGSYLVVVAILLGFLGTWEGQLRRGLVELAGFPRRRHRTLEDATRDALENAATILRAPLVVLAWEDTEEPWLDTMTWCAGEVTRERHDPEQFKPLVAEPLRDSAFLCLDLSIDPPNNIRTTERGLVTWRGQPLHPELARRVEARNVLSFPVIGEYFNARLFAFDKTQLVSDDLVVGLILGRQIVAMLEQHFLMKETRHSAANQERIRVARELHDGVAQSLAAATFHVRGLRQSSDPEGVRQGLEEVERLLVNEQRELRLFMQELRPWSASSDEMTFRQRMVELCDRVSALWAVEVELEDTDEIGPPMAWEVYRLAQEGVINAARHAQPTRIRLAAKRNGQGVSIRIANDGNGFPFEGEYDLATLEEKKIGPVSLKERIASLKGDLLLRTDKSGTVLEISLPQAQGVIT